MISTKNLVDLSMSNKKIKWFFFSSTSQHINHQKIKILETNKTNFFLWKTKYMLLKII